MPARLRPQAALLAVALVLAGVAGVSAQAPVATPAAFDIGVLEGVQRAVMRVYAFDVAAMAEDLSSPEGRIQGPEGLIYLYGVVAEFESPERAAAAVTAAESAVLDDLAGDALRLNLNATPADDLGDAAVHLTGTGTSGAEEIALDGYVAQDGAWLYLALALGVDDASDDAARGLVTYALGRPAGANAGEHRPDGSSTGGIWAKLPGSREDELLHGTQPMVDVVLYPTDDQDG